MVAQVRRKHPVRCSMARGAISVAVFQEVLFSEFPWVPGCGLGFCFPNFRGLGISVVSDFPGSQNSSGPEGYFGFRLRIWFAPRGIRRVRTGSSANRLISYYLRNYETNFYCVEI